MSFALSASLPCGQLSKVPDKPLLAAALPAGGPLSTRRSSTVDCLATPCPKCNKRTIVRRSPNTFDCLNCNFHKQLPPISAHPNLTASRGLTGGLISGGSNSGLGEYSIGTGPEGSGLGQGSLSRLIENRRTLPNERSLHHTSAEPDAAQPLIFAAIAVIIGILIL